MAFEGVKEGIKSALHAKFPKLFNPLTSFIGRVYSVLTSAANGNTMRGSLSELSKPARVEPFTIISNDLMQREDVIHDVLDTVLSVFSAYYLQAIALDAKVEGVRVADYLDKFNPGRAASSWDVAGALTDSAFGTAMQLGLVPNYAGESYSNPADSEINPPYFNLKNYNFSLPFRSNEITLKQPYVVSTEANVPNDPHSLKMRQYDNQIKNAEAALQPINQRLWKMQSIDKPSGAEKASINALERQYRRQTSLINDLKKEKSDYLNSYNQGITKGEELAVKHQLDTAKMQEQQAHELAMLGAKGQQELMLEREKAKIRTDAEIEAHAEKTRINNLFDQRAIDDKAIQEIKESTNQIVGKIFNVTIVVEGLKFTTPVTIRLIAVPATPDRVSFIMDGKRMDRSFSDRWRRWRAGRISFFRDLILCQDLIDEHKKRLLEDQDGILHAIEQRKSDLTKASLATNDISMADATNIFIISKETESKIERDMGGKLSQQRTRDKIFSRTYAMLIVVVDLRSERIVIYTRGVSLPTTFSFRQLKNKTKNSNDAGVLEILKQLTMGNPPSF